jgi:hypothetical protein
MMILFFFLLFLLFFGGGFAFTFLWYVAVLLFAFWLIGAITGRYWTSPSRHNFYWW